MAIVDESAAGEVARVGTELPSALNGANAFLRTEVVNRADIVETTARDKVSGRRVCAGHDPGRPEWDGVDLVRRIGVPDDELAVLGGGHEVALVCCPMHRINLRKMSLERAPWLHDDPGERLDFSCHRTD